MTGKTTVVSIGEIALALKIDEWFDKDRFSFLTSIAKRNCYKRLSTLVEGGYLDKDGSAGVKCHYRMNVSHKRSMIERDKINRFGLRRGRSAYKQKKNSHQKYDEVIAEAYMMNAELLLKSIGFI